MGFDLEQISSRREQKKIEANSEHWLNRDIQLFGKELSLADREAFYSEMEVLLRAGLDIKTALELIREGHRKKKNQNLFKDIHARLIAGASLTESMKVSERFSVFETASIRIAEESGQLLEVLQELAAYFRRRMQFRRLLIGALSYPILVVFVAVLALAFLLRFLVPLFSDIYKRLDQRLPELTQMVIDLSDFLGHYGFWIVLSFLGFVLLIWTQRKKAVVRHVLAQSIIRIPIFGGLIKDLYLARFYQGMSFLLRAKVPLINALSLSEQMVGFYPIEKSIPHLKDHVLKGGAFYEGLEKHSIYSKRAMALIKVGEEANQLPDMTAKLASQYNENIEQKTKLLGSLIEPVIIVFLAITVGLILVAMYLPIFKLVTNFGVQ